MEFQEFCKEYKRMCLSNECKDCPLNDLAHLTDTCEVSVIDYPQRAYDIVEQWAKDHQFVTNADKFREVFGKPIESYGAPYLNALIVCDNGATTSLEWLQQEYKEPEEDDNGNDR